MINQDENLYFGDPQSGQYGGMFVPEILVPALKQLKEAFEASLEDQDFLDHLADHLNDFAGRPTPILHCKNLSKHGNAEIYFKREDLLHGGAHKTNQVLAQALLAQRMGKNRIIAETGAGQHGVACAMVCALLDMELVVYMGAKDVERQQPNVQRMKLLGAEVVPVSNGSSSLKDAINEALRDWTASYETTHYLIGTVAGPAPFPAMVARFQRIIGDEARTQIIAKAGRLPDEVIACVGGGSNAIGIFQAFIPDENVALIGVEPGGKGEDTPHHGATLCQGEVGIFQGCITKVLQDEEGQIHESFSVSAGLDYPAVGPQHVYLQRTGRAKYVSVNDDAALAASLEVTRSEGLIPALESSHAVAYAIERAKSHPADAEKLILLVNMSGRGDKDLNTVLNKLGISI